MDYNVNTTRSSEFSATKPLPPIGTSREEKDKDGGTDLSDHSYQDDDQRSTASSVGFDRPGEGSARPRIIRGFRPEALTDEEMEKELQAQRTVSFINGSPITETRKTYDGREILFVTLNTQTDWDWVQDVEGTARSISGEEKPVSVTGKERTTSPRSASTKAEVTEEKWTPEASQYQMPYNDEYGIPILDLSSDTDDITESEEEQKIAKNEQEQKKAKNEQEKKIAKNEQKQKKAKKEQKQKIAKNEQELKTLSEIESEMEDESSDDEVSHKKIKDDRTFMPSVGPPNILQYQRESEKHDIKVKEPEARLEVTEFETDEMGMTHGMFSGCCEFCNKPIKPFPTMDQQLKLPPEVLYCCNDYREFVEFVLSTSNEMEEEQKNKNKLIDIKPHEHVGSKQERNAAKEKAVQRMRERELQRRQQEATGLQQNFFALGAGGVSKAGFMKMPLGLANITMKDLYEESIDPLEMSLECLDTCPSRFKLKGAEGMSKDGAGVRLKSGNVSTQKHIIGEGHSFACEAYQSAQIASVYLNALRMSETVARQMKTINYQLSSQKCLEEGWTLRAPSPLLDDVGDDVFIPEPLNPDMIAEGKLRDRPLIEKFYESGKKFLTMFPDGTGNVFYPSGNLAILISSVKLGQYYYTIHQDLKRSGVAAAFEPNGYGYCYFPNGDIRLYIDQYGGIELDNYGARRRKWSWKEQVTHVHAPPFQPICIGINRHMGVRVMNQDNIALTFSASKRSCRFNMGSRLKLVAPENAPVKEVEEEYIFLEEKKNHVDALLNKVANLLKFPNNPKLDKMLPPLHIATKQIKTEKMKKERQIFLAQQSAREKKQPSITVNS